MIIFYDVSLQIEITLYTKILLYVKQRQFWWKKGL